MQEGRLVSVCELGQEIQECLCQEGSGHIEISECLETLQDRSVIVMCMRNSGDIIFHGV